MLLCITSLIGQAVRSWDTCRVLQKHAHELLLAMFVRMSSSGCQWIDISRQLPVLQ